MIGGAISCALTAFPSFYKENTFLIFQSVLYLFYQQFNTDMIIGAYN